MRVRSSAMDVKTQAALHKAQAQLDEVTRERDAMAKGVWRAAHCRMRWSNAGALARLRCRHTIFFSPFLQSLRASKTRTSAATQS